MNGLWFVTKIAFAAVAFIVLIYAIAEIWKRCTPPMVLDETDENDDEIKDYYPPLEKKDLEVDDSKYPEKLHNTHKVVEQDRCVLCGRFTTYKRNVPIANRAYYVEGAGQLCKRCYEKLYEE
jgi:hypothetical protein